MLTRRDGASSEVAPGEFAVPAAEMMRFDWDATLFYFVASTIGVMNGRRLSWEEFMSCKYRDHPTEEDWILAMERLDMLDWSTIPDDVGFPHEELKKLKREAAAKREQGCAPEEF